MGELLQGRHRQQGVSGTRQLYSDAVAPVVAVQAQNQASKGRDLSTLAPLRALWARTSDQAWTRRAVGEGERSQRSEPVPPVRDQPDDRLQMAGALACARNGGTSGAVA